MFTQSDWNEWVKSWKWIIETAGRRNWEVSKLKIKKPLSLKKINKEIEKHNLILPKDFLYVVENFSSGVYFDYSIEGEEPEEEFSEIFSGGTADGLWDFNSIHRANESILDWQKDCFDNPEDPYDKIWYNKTGIQFVPNGDMIAFDIIENSDIFPVVYLSHEGDEMHGQRLGDNFIEFITNWSLLGCPGNEDWQMEPFLEGGKLSAGTERAEKWIKWLKVKNKKPTSF